LQKLFCSSFSYVYVNKSTYLHKNLLWFISMSDFAMRFFTHLDLQKHNESTIDASWGTLV
jgi:hypothetical protein